MNNFGSHIKIDRWHRSSIKICSYERTIITKDTEIRIWFDSSGSMDSTLDPLQEMRDNHLKDTLLPFYNNDEELYNEKVTVNSWSNERTFERLSVEPDVIEDGIIHLVFQDEANSIYHDSHFNSSEITTYYENDISNLRNKLENTFVNNGYKAVVFQVKGFPNFNDFLKAVENGEGEYASPYGTSDIDEDIVAFRYNINDGDDPQYYADLIESEVL